MLPLLVSDMVSGALQYLGAGGQVGVAALLVGSVFYANKVLSVGSKIRNLVAYGMAFCVLLAIVLAAGWGTLDVSQITQDVGRALGLAGDLPLGGVLDKLRGVVGL